ncbi:hypothetical protein BGX38DRAFT_1143638 [Terfezia claveryi]|nr:hypothetical protein BGX38DRAFT_1143638 [Terfezia claveryi]
MYSITFNSNLYISVVTPDMNSQLSFYQLFNPDQKAKRGFPKIMPQQKFHFCNVSVVGFGTYLSRCFALLSHSPSATTTVNWPTLVLLHNATYLSTWDLKSTGILAARTTRGVGGLKVPRKLVVPEEDEFRVTTTNPERRLKSARMAEKKGELES